MKLHAAVAAFKRYNILLDEAASSPLRFFDYLGRNSASILFSNTSIRDPLSLSRRFTKGEGGEAWQQQGSPAGVPNPRRAGTKIPNVGLYSSIEGPDDLSTAYYTSHRPCANFSPFLTRVQNSDREKFKGVSSVDDNSLVSVKLIDDVRSVVDREERETCSSHDEWIREGRERGGSNEPFQGSVKSFRYERARDPTARPRFSL